MKKKVRENKMIYDGWYGCRLSFCFLWILMCAMWDVPRRTVWQFVDILCLLVWLVRDPLRLNLSISSRTSTDRYHQLRLKRRKHLHITKPVQFTLNRTINSPNIFSGCSPLSKPTGFFSSGAFFFAELALSCSIAGFRFFWLSSAVGEIQKTVWKFVSEQKSPLIYLPFSAALLFLWSSNADIKSGQSKFSSGSHVLSSDEYPFHFRKYSTLPLRIRRSRTFSTEYSSSTASPVLLVASSAAALYESTTKQFDC